MCEKGMNLGDQRGRILGAEPCPLQIHELRHQLPLPQKVTTFIYRDFKKVIKFK